MPDKPDVVEYQGIELQYQDGEYWAGDGYIALCKKDGEAYDGKDPLNEAVVLEFETNDIIVNYMFDWEKDVTLQTLREFTKEQRDEICKTMTMAEIEYTLNRQVLTCKIKDLGYVVDVITDVIIDFDLSFDDMSGYV